MQKFLIIFLAIVSSHWVFVGTVYSRNDDLDPMDNSTMSFVRVQPPTRWDSEKDQTSPDQSAFLWHVGSGDLSKSAIEPKLYKMAVMVSSHGSDQTVTVFGDYPDYLGLRVRVTDSGASLESLLVNKSNQQVTSTKVMDNCVSDSRCTASLKHLKNRVDTALDYRIVNDEDDRTVRALSFALAALEDLVGESDQDKTDTLLRDGSTNTTLGSLGSFEHMEWRKWKRTHHSNFYNGSENDSADGMTYRGRSNCGSSYSSESDSNSDSGWGFVPDFNFDGRSDLSDLATFVAVY